MYRFISIKIVGIAGALFILSSYYLLWISPDTELQTVIVRTRAAIVMNLFGSCMILFYMFKKK